MQRFGADLRLRVQVELFQPLLLLIHAAQVDLLRYREGREQDRRERDAILGRRHFSEQIRQSHHSKD